MPLLTRKPWAIAIGGAFLLAASLAPAAARGQTPDAPGAGTPAPPAPPPEEPRPRRPRFRFGPEVGVYLPSNSKTRQRFGDSWVSFGLGLGAIRQAEGGGRIVFDLDILTRRRGNNRAFIAPIGLGYRRALGRGPVRPYAGGSVNLYVVDLRSDADNVSSGVRTTGGGSVFAGATLRGNAYLEARYLAVSRIKGFDLSGLNLTAGFRF